ncbi:erythromycin esterase family protein [Nocardioides sp. SYSU DS0663]|uniref:erythromycin esterase family protein n=1 Tax=Nocardioides sp. SYSU DS0663 TaxID=3416445 RepID=UPI003F4B4AA6
MTATDPAALAQPLADPADLDPLLDRIGDARVVCLGEASHGTHEYYRWRELLTRRLVEERGFDAVAVEGDWPDCWRVSCSVTGAPGAPTDPREALAGYVRWPTWMWANEEVAGFLGWLRGHNDRRPAGERVGFYGLDVYSLWESLRAVVDHAREHDPAELEAALAACRCLEPYAEDPQAYARSTRFVPTGCETEVVGLLRDLLRRHADDLDATGRAPAERDATFAAERNAEAAVGAEAYYRSMVRGGPESWNIRDTHMVETLDHLLEHHGSRRGRPAKVVVWAHNTHVGDARFTDMSDAGLVNLGQLVRERYGEEECVLVGFGSHRGTVVAGREWGLPREVMRVPAARAGSTEALLHDSLPGRSALFVFPPDLPQWAAEERPHRAIGVVYRPEAERWGNYVPTVLGRRYDAFLWIDETSALRPLPRGGHGTDGPAGELESWPTGA